MSLFKEALEKALALEAAEKKEQKPAKEEFGSVMAKVGEFLDVDPEDVTEVKSDALLKHAGKLPKGQAAEKKFRGFMSYVAYSDPQTKTMRVFIKKGDKNKFKKMNIVESEKPSKFMELFAEAMKPSTGRGEKTKEAFVNRADDLIASIARVGSKEAAQDLRGKLIDVQEKAKEAMRYSAQDVRDEMEDIVRDTAHAIRDLEDKYEL